MANPFDQFDEAPASSAPAPAANPFDQFDDHAAPAPAPPAMPSPQDTQAHIRKMLDDPATHFADFKAYYDGLHSQMRPEDIQTYQDRDTFNAAHPGQVMAIGTQAGDPSGKTPAVVDNRPYSFGQGMIDGGRHVLSNVAEGAQWVANNLGTDALGMGKPGAAFGDGVKRYYADDAARQDYQGSDGGRFAGELLASAPAAALTPELEGAALLTRSGIMAADGAGQAALTTHSNTLGGVGRDATTGAALGLGLGSAARALGSLGGTPSAAAQAGRDVLNAADNLSRGGIEVRPLPGDTGGALARGISSGAEAGILSNPPLARASERYLEGIGLARDRAAMAAGGGVAPRSLDAVAGDILSGVGGLGDYGQRSAERIGRMYDDAATLTGNAEFPTPRALATVNALIARGEAIPGDVPGLQALRNLRDDLTPTPDRVVPPNIWEREFGSGQPTVIPGNRAQFAIDTLRRLRTGFGDNFESGQRVARETANEIWGPLSEDIDQGLRDAGMHQQADAWANANREWAQRQTNLDEMVDPTLGSRNQGQLADQIRQMARNDPDGLARALQVVSPDQANAVRGALVGELGRSSPGFQNADGSLFSLNKFGTDFQDDNFSAGFKASLPQQAQNDLADIATLAGAAKRTGRYRNTSGTARAADALGILKALGSTLSGPGAGAAVGGIPGIAAGLAAQYGLGHAMASPTLARALVRAGEVRPGARALQGLTTAGQYGAPVLASDANSPTSLSDDPY